TAIILMSCEKNGNSERDTPKDDSCSIVCPGEGICTDQFEHIVVKIKNLDNTPLKLDRYYTVRNDDQTIIDMQSGTTRFEDSIRKAHGNYPVFSDVQTAATTPCGRVFYFIGYKD